MAKWSEPYSGRESVDALVDVWRDSCLIDGESLIFPEESIWTEDNIAALMKSFVEEELLDDRTFEEKLSEQLSGLDRGPVVLMAEVIAIYLAFASQRTIGGERKIELINMALAAADEQLPDEGVVADAMWCGIGGAGQGFNRGRPFMIAYLIRFASKLFERDRDERAELVGEDSGPWEFQAWLDEAVPERGAHALNMRSILLHLLYPDTYERIAVQSDKWDIAYAFADLVEGLDVETEDVDRSLFQIREALEDLDHFKQPAIDAIDFYYSPLREGWDADDARAGRRAGSGLSPLEALMYKRQVVYYGPPGTSKTFRASALAEQLIRRAAMRLWGITTYLKEEKLVRQLVGEQIERRQLHPAYTYEDFIAGLRLEDNSTKPTPGHLLQLVERINEANAIKSDLKPLPWVLILDELNRADLSRLLGEVFSALENRDTAIRLSAAGTEDWPEFKLPENLYIIGTMNLIDQSVEQLDFALRRRFFWLLADYDEKLIVPVVRQRWEALDREAQPWLKRHTWDYVEPDIELLAARATKLNEAIEAERLLGPQYKVGHTYLFDVVGLIASSPRLRSKSSWRGNYLWSRNGEVRAPLEDLWSYSLEPLLSEYLAGVPEDARTRILGGLRKIFVAPVER